MKRVDQIIGQIGGSERKLALNGVAGAAQRDDDIVIVSAVRTAIGKAKKGGFRDTHPGDLLAAVLKGTIDRTKLKPELVGDIVVGNVLAAGGFATQARMAMFLAGFPDTVPISTCNRQCSSGLQAVAHVAGAIKAGQYEIGLACGLESMSKCSMGPESVGDINERVFDNEKAAACLNSMGQTSENVASKFGVSRDKQDKLAVLSHQRASKAIKEGRFKNEIVPVTTKVTDKDGKETEITVSEDEGPRADTSLAGLGKLKPAFSKDGTTTAGNSSQVSDGAAAVLLTTRRKAKELGLPIQAIFRGFAVTGVGPEIMGIGPATAIPAALKKAGLEVKDVDVFELNEAFASQAVYCIETLKLDAAKVNPNGGAIALGHPLGCTGARQIATLINELKRSGGRYGVVSMCIGTGMGAAGVFEVEK